MEPKELDIRNDDEKTIAIKLKEWEAEGKLYSRHRGIRERLYDFLIKLLWKLNESIDASMSYESLGNLYCNVPDNLKNEYLRVDKFYHIDHDDPKKEEIIAWLEREE